MISREYLRLAWESPEVRAQIEEAAHTTAGIHKISQKTVADIQLTLPPLAEQAEIVARVGRMTEIIEPARRQLAAASKRADKLTQSILAKAFRGQLVPTEAELARAESREYETAAELVERVSQNQTTGGRTVALPAFARGRVRVVRKRAPDVE